MWGSAPGQEEEAMASVALRPKPLGPLPPSHHSVYLPVLLFHKEARAVGAGPARRGDARPRKKLARRHVHHGTPSALSHFTSSRRSVAPLCNFADLLFSCGLRFPLVAASTPFLSDPSPKFPRGNVGRVPQKYPRQEGGDSTGLGGRDGRGGGRREHEREWRHGSRNRTGGWSRQHRGQELQRDGVPQQALPERGVPVESRRLSSEAQVGWLRAGEARARRWTASDLA